MQKLIGLVLIIVSFYTLGVALGLVTHSDKPLTRLEKLLR